MILLAYFELFSVTNASILEESKMVISAVAESIAWQMGLVTLTRLSNTSCKSSKKFCLKHVSLEATGTSQNSRRGFE